jgi:hypothetical protein
MRVTALLLVAAAGAAASPPDPVSFPGAAAAKDPTGRYAVVPAAESGRRELLLRDEKSGATRSLLSFGRSATVFWSPDGGALAVTDRRTSSRATTLLFFADKPGAVDLSAELSRALGPLPEQTGNDHVYLEVVRWLDAKKLRLRLRGYGARDPDGFDELFDYELGGRFRRPAF